MRQLLIGKRVTPTYGSHPEPFTISDVTVSSVAQVPAFGHGGPSVLSYFATNKGIALEHRCWPCVVQRGGVADRRIRPGKRLLLPAKLQKQDSYFPLELLRMT